MFYASQNITMEEAYATDLPTELPLVLNSLTPEIQNIFGWHDYPNVALQARVRSVHLLRPASGIASNISRMVIDFMLFHDTTGPVWLLIASPTIPSAFSSPSSSRTPGNCQPVQKYQP